MTACTLASALGSTLGNEYGKLLPFTAAEAVIAARISFCILDEDDRLVTK